MEIWGWRIRQGFSPKMQQSGAAVYLPGRWHPLRPMKYIPCMGGNVEREGTRVDKWLWAARFFKTRALAAEAIDGGKVDVNGDRTRRSRELKVGDSIRIRQGAYEQHVIVRELSAKRGGAPEAAKLYEETPESLAAREALAVQMKSLPKFMREAGKPTRRPAARSTSSAIAASRSDG
jgi:ribosome-associated heat shock protein Hsp15